MRVFSTFSGISAATAAWRELGWTFAGYAEINPNACAVLAARCGATRPKYLPLAQAAYLSDEAHALAARLGAGTPKGSLPERLRSFLKPGVDPANLTRDQIHRLYELDDIRSADMAFKELDSRREVVAAMRRASFAVTWTVPNFGDVWSITDDDLEALGPIDILEGGSPCQAFSAAGNGEGMLDHRGALVFGFLDLVERMRRINNLQWVLWENVKGVLNGKHNGFGYLLGQLARHGGGPVLPDSGRYANAGYVSGPDGAVAWRLLDAQYFGVPQRRERVFALAHVGLGSARRDPREILFDEASEGRRPRSPKRSRQAAVAVPEESAAELGGFEGPVVFMAGQGRNARSIAESSTVSPTLRSSRSGSNQVPSIAYRMRRADAAGEGTSPSGSKATAEETGQSRYIVRKLLPIECERLQGFPEDWTAVKINGEIMSDPSRYECIGNSMAVPVMRWLGKRLDDAAKADGTSAAAA